MVLFCMRRILFLDIDGVLNHEGTKTRIPGGFIGLDPQNLRYLANVVAATNCEVRIIDRTPIRWGDKGWTSEIMRASEIMEWLENNKVEPSDDTKLVVVDDIVIAVNPALAFVKTDWKIGLDLEGATKLIECLGRSNLRILPETLARVETGAVQFGDDWPGCWIRGDNAAMMAACLNRLLRESQIPDNLAFEKLYVDALLKLLQGCNVSVLNKKGVTS